MPIRLNSEQLDTPTHRFDYAVPSATSGNVGKGLAQYGPFDSSTNRNFTNATITLVAPEKWRKEVNTVAQALREGHPPYFRSGFKSFFQMEDFSFGQPFRLDSEDIDSYLRAVDDILAADVDMAIVFTSADMLQQGHRSPYWAMKVQLTQAGIPSQMVMVDRLRNGSPHHVELKYLIVNLASQVYAKLGGTPWVIHRPDSSVDLIIGVGKSVYQSGRIGRTKRTLGFAAAYRSNGAFLWFDSTQETTSYDSLQDELTESIVSTAEQYAKREGLPAKVVIHSYKRIGPAERNAKKQLEERFEDSNVVLAHLNDSHNYRIYDDGNQSGLPQSGLWIRTGDNKGFVLTAGRRKWRVGSPIPIELTIEADGTTEEIIATTQETAHEVFDLCSVYWKDQFGTIMPITIRYAKDIAEIIENAQKINDEGLLDVNVDQLVHPRLRRIPWFL